MEFRTITRYPTYAINKSCTIINKISKKEVQLLKRTDPNPNQRGLAQVSLRKNGKKHKETVMNLVLEEFTPAEIMGEPEEDDDEINQLVEQWNINPFGGNFV